MVAEPRASLTSRNRAWKDLARAAGVSMTTASLALNNHPRVAEQTRRRVAEAATRIGFVRNYGARRLARTRTNARSATFDQVGLIYLSDATVDLDGICIEMMRGAEHELSKLHASLVFVRAGERGDWEKVERLTQSGGVDGWLVIGQVTDVIANRLRDGKLPFVILGDHRCTTPVHNVNADSAAIGRMAVEHLASLGQRRIAYLGGTQKFAYQHLIRDGFRATVRELGLDDDERLFADVTVWYDDSGPEHRRAIQWLRDTTPRPTAVFTIETGGAASTHEVLRRAGVTVPADISIIGCETPGPLPRSQNLTRIEWPFAELGRHGAQLLHRLAAEPGVRSTEMKIAPTLVRGWSTAPPSDNDLHVQDKKS
jgi:DNA-binding LacI/PurR family transcriptional regulator